MEFLLLGPLEVRGDDGPVDVGGSRQRALLAALLVRAGEVVVADRLVEEVWGDGTLADPTNALQAAISRLRRALGDGASIESRPPGYLLEVEDRCVDVARFERAVAEGRRLLADGDAPAASEVLTGALDEWRGEFLADLAGLEFVAPVAARLGELRLAATEARVEADLALGRDATLIGELETLVATHPYRERLRGQLMLALARSGRQAEALEAFHDARRLLGDDLGIDPGPELQRRYETILRQEDSPPPAAVASPTARATGNLPASLTRFVGRDREIDQMLDLVRGVRLVTLTGPGGAGKTRLAVEAADRVRDEIPGGVWFIDLSPVSDPSAVAGAVMAGLGLRDDGGPEGSDGPLPRRLAAYLRDRELLGVMDNCEHLVDTVAVLVRRMLEVGSGLRVICTSREPLSITGETVLSIPSLRIPPPGADATDPTLLGAFGSVELFMDRAVAADPSFTLDATSGPAVAEICRRLDGMPLALELAAARLRAFGVDDLAAHLDDRFAVLVVGDRTAQPRQRTLRNLVEWSWDLLDDVERIVFRRLSVLAGRFDLDLAVAVCGDDSVIGAVVAETVTGLVDRSLVIAAHHDGNSGFRLLETLRAFGREHLDASGEADAVRRRHAEHLAAIIEELFEEIRGPRQPECMRRLDDLHDDSVTALDWALRSGNVDLAARMTAKFSAYLHMRGRRAEAAMWTRRVIDAGGSGVGYALTRLWHAAVTLFDRAASEILDEAHEALSMIRELGNDADRAQGAMITALVEAQVGNTATALELVEETRRSATPVGKTHLLGYADFLEGLLLFHGGEPDRAEELIGKAVETARRSGDRWGEQSYILTVIVLAEARGDYEGALDLIEQSRPLIEQLGGDEQLAVLEARRASMLMLTGELEQAEASVEAARTQATTLGMPSVIALADNIGGAIARRAGRLEEARDRHRRALDFYEEVGLPQGLSVALAGLGTVAELQGDAELALRFHQRGLDVIAEHEDPRAIAFALEGLAGARAALGDGEQAARLLGAAACLRDGAGRPLPAVERIDVDRATAAATRLVGEERFAEAFADGAQAELHELTRSSAHLS